MAPLLGWQDFGLWHWSSVFFAWETGIASSNPYSSGLQAACFGRNNVEDDASRVPDRNGHHEMLTLKRVREPGAAAFLLIQRLTISGSST